MSDWSSDVCSSDLVRMAEDQMVDARKAGTHGFDIGDDTVFVAVVEIILASGIIEQREIAALDEYGEPGADVDHMHLVSRAGQGFARRGAADHQRPCLADIAMRAVGQPDPVPTPDFPAPPPPVPGAPAAPGG